MLQPTWTVVNAVRTRLKSEAILCRPAGRIRMPSRFVFSVGDGSVNLSPMNQPAYPHPIIAREGWPFLAGSVVLALLVTGNTLSFVATVGLVALAGIEVKNTILLVDFTNQLRRQGVGLNEAIERAGEMRFLPIVLTALTSIGGLLPIAWSSNPLISPLAIVMIGGLLSSTLLSRVVTPVIYKLMPPRIDGNNLEI